MTGCTDAGRWTVPMMPLTKVYVYVSRLCAWQIHRSTRRQCILIFWICLQEKRSQNLMWNLMTAACARASCWDAVLMTFFLLLYVYIYIDWRLENHVENKCTLWVKKDQWCFPFLTSSNVYRFSKFFHLFIQWESCNKTLVMFSTTP